LAPAFLIVGSPEGAGLQLAVAMAQLVCCSEDDKPCDTCDGCQRVARRDHPDVHWLEPEKKSRIISVGDPNKKHKDPGIRFRLLEPLSQTSYYGGWKVGIIRWADRMSESAANALLKMLEEPPRETLLLLVTEQPHMLLPTIVSRCQRLILPERERPVEADWRSELEDWLAGAGARGPVTSLARASRLLNLLDRVKEDITKEESASSGAVIETVSSSEQDDEERSGAGAGEDSAAEESLSREFREARISSRLIKVRTEILRAIQLWQRDVLACKMGADANTLHFSARREVIAKQAAACDVATVYARIRAADEAAARLATNMNALMVLDAMVRAGV
jgi:DNA polymerase III delta prime subunit